MKKRLPRVASFLCALCFLALTASPAFAAPETPVIPFCQHVWDAPGYLWSEDGATCTASRTCTKNANHKTSETAVAAQTGYPATCTDPARTVFTAAFSGEAYDTQTRVVFSGEALGHDWGEVKYEWWDDACTATRVCKRDPDHAETETANALCKVSACATGTASGTLTYYASFENEAFPPATKNVSYDASAVLWGDANGDGAVDAKDVVRLKNYFAERDDDGNSRVSLFPGADANFDGAVSNKDIVRLKNYLADLDPSTGASKVILGPDDRIRPAKTVTRADLDAIPMATPSMSEDELRQIVLEYYRFVLNTPWVSRTPVQYALSSGLAFDLGADLIWCGLPYTNAGSCIQQFLDYYDPDTGEFINPFGEDLDEYLGNNCSSSLYWAWGRISSTIRFTATHTMTQNKGVVKVGDYALDTGYASFSNNDHYNTRAVCDANGLDVMCRAYASLKPADGAVAYDEVTNPDKLKHHTMLVYEVHVEMKGTQIDPDKSYIIFYEQNSLDYAKTINGQSVRVLGRLDRKSTFRALFGEGYIPITCKELAGLSEVKAAFANISTANGTTLTTSQLLKKKLNSNYSIARAIVTVRNGYGRVVARAVDRFAFNNYQVALSDVVGEINGKLPAGTYSVTVEADVANGQILTAFTGTLTKS